MSYPSKTEFDNLRNSLPLTYQTRGNYAFRTDLASNINTALKNVNTALASYAKKTDIPVVPTNVVTKTDLAGYALRSEIPVVPSNVASKSDLASYALASDLTKYQPAGRYVSPSELEAYQPKGDYAVTKDLVSYAKSSDLASYQPKGDYALASDLASYAKLSTFDSYAKSSDLANFQPKGDYALASNLANYQPKGDYAVKSDFANYQPKGDYAVKSDFANYQPKGDYQPKGEYALAKDLGSYAKSSDLANYQPTGNYALKTDLVNYTNKATANDFAAQQTFNGGIILGANSSSNLQGKVNIPNATVGNLNVTNIKAASIDGYAKTSDLANYQPKGDYATKSDLDSKTSDLTSYAKTTDLVTIYQPKGSYAKTDTANTFTGNQTFNAANTFNAQQTFEQNAIVKTGANKPFEVQGEGGLTVGNATIGNLNVSGNATIGNLHGYAKTSDLDSYAKTADVAKTGTTNTFIAANTFNAQQTFSGNAVVKTIANTPFEVQGAGGLKVTGGNLNVSGNATIGNLNVSGSQTVAGSQTVGGNTLNLGAATFMAGAGNDKWVRMSTDGKNYNYGLAAQDLYAANDLTVKGNATVDTDLTVKGKANIGNLNVSGKTLKLGGATFIVGGDKGSDDWVRMHSENGQPYNYGLAAKNFWTDGGLYVAGNATVNGTANISTANIATNLTVGGSQTVGNIKVGNNLNITPNHIESPTGRLHVSSSEILYLLPKEGVSIGKEWGGTGDLRVQGSQAVDGSQTVKGNATVSGNLNVSGTINTNNILIGGRFKIEWEEHTQSLLIKDTQGGNKGVYMRPSTNYWQALN